MGRRTSVRQWNQGAEEAMNRSAVAASALLSVATAVSGCAIGGSSPPRILNTERIERAIEQAAWTNRSIRTAVTCPAGEPQKAHWSFNCTAAFAKGFATFTVTELDGAGHVHFASP
jgi:hypothetical protein